MPFSPYYCLPHLISFIPFTSLWSKEVYKNCEWSLYFYAYCLLVNIESESLRVGTLLVSLFKFSTFFMLWFNILLASLGLFYTSAYCFELLKSPFMSWKASAFYKLRSQLQSKLIPYFSWTFFFLFCWILPTVLCLRETHANMQINGAYNHYESWIWINALQFQLFYFIKVCKDHFSPFWFILILFFIVFIENEPLLCRTVVSNPCLISSKLYLLIQS